MPLGLRAAASVHVSAARRRVLEENMSVGEDLQAHVASCGPVDSRGDGAAR